jgi:hypothetical protein
MDRSELQSKSCKEKESELRKGKCCKNGQFGYTLISTTKYLNTLLFGGYSPSVPGNLSGRWTGR